MVINSLNEVLTDDIAVCVCSIPCILCKYVTIPITEGLHSSVCGVVGCNLVIKSDKQS